MKKVLWLVSWYPNEREPFSGDFIQRQAEAVALFQPIKIIFAGKQADSPGLNPKLNMDSKSKNLEEYIVYYQSRQIFLSKITSLVVYLKKNLGVIRQLRKNNELPDLAHVHVALKAGLVALYLKWKYQIPFILTEHWTGYYSLSIDSLYKKSFLERYLTKKIIKNASLLLPVSEALGNQIDQNWANVPFQKIMNVVNTRFFFQEQNQPAIFRFIHISSLSYQKNPSGILHAFSELLKAGIDAELVFVGPVSIDLQGTIKANKLPTEKFLCTDEIPYEEVGAELRKSSALVMFSFYENMPCVILEALCTGIPVIATRVGGIHEVIGEDNGILVQPGNETELLDAMKKIMHNYDSYNREKMSRDARDQFSYQRIGNEILQVYDSVLEKK